MSNKLSLPLAVVLLSACITPTDSTREPGAGGGAGAGATPIAVDSAGSTETVTQNLTTNVRDLEASLGFLETSKLLPELLRFGPEVDTEEVGQVIPGEGDQGDIDGEDAAIEVELQRPLEELIEELRERVLIEDSVEDDGDERTVIYMLDPERVCPEADEDGMADGGVDAECVRQLTEVPVRVRVTSFAEGDVDLALLIGEGRIEVARAQIHRNMLAAELDLGALREAALLIGDDEDDAKLPDVMEGVVRAELRRNDARDFTATISIGQDIRIEDRDGDSEIAVRIGETPALVSVRLDGVAKVITAQLGLGEVEVALPWQQIVDSLYAGDAGGGCATAIGEDGEPGEVECWQEESEPAPEVEGALELFLSGLTGRTSFSGDEDRIEITDLTLGGDTTTVKVDGDTIIALDLNKNAGRKAAIAVQEVRNGNLRIEVAPELDVAIAFALHHVADAFEADSIPSFMLDERLGVRLDGAATPALETVGTDEARQLRVADGELTLWSTAMDDDVIVPEGQCIAGPDDDGEEAADAGHPLFGGIEAVECGL